MKKLLIAILLISTPAHAGTLSLHTNMSPDATLISGLNDNFQSISDWAGGDVEGAGIQGSTVNIKANSIGVTDIADEADPSVRDKELLGITLANNGFVYSGCVPATDTDLTSDISACVAFADGVRISKAAESNTYTANKDTWVDVSTASVYTFSEVSNGAAEPATAANSIRLAKVVTNGTAITTVTDEANRRLPNLIIPSNLRDGMLVSRESTTTLAVLPGMVEVNSASVTKSAKTVLTVSGVAGDWSTGSDESGASEYDYVGIDADGNIKLVPARPTHQNYDLSITDGKKRYVTSNSTVYRILGYFRLNGSTQLASIVSQDTSSVSNLREFEFPNKLMKIGVTDIAATSSYTTMDDMVIYLDSSGGIIHVMFTAPFATEMSTGNIRIVVDNEEKIDTLMDDNFGGSGKNVIPLQWSGYLSPGTHTILAQYKESSNMLQNGASQGERVLIVWED